MADVVLYEVAERVATITLNRPEARNALSREVQRTLRQLLTQADGDDDVDVVILTGTDPAFSAGVDLKELGAADSGGFAAAVSAPAATAAAGPRGPFPPVSKPVIGAINGVAVTGGFEIALNCDWLIASERARFADTHARVGIQPGWGLTVLLAEAVGVRRARELSATGNYLDAETAREWGLVNRVVPHAELLPACRALAADIVSNDQRAVRRILQTYDDVVLADGATGWAIEADVSRQWLLDGAGTAAQVESRRAAIMQRGRTQL